MYIRQAIKFKSLVTNKFWDRIITVNDQHVTASQQYLHLMQDLETQRVAFNDIKNFLMNEAKRAGLYQKSNGNYPKWKEVKDTAWGRALHNTMAWIANNYDGSYSKRITSEDRKQARQQRKAEKAQKKVTTVTRKADGGEIRQDTVETTVDMDAPVESSLTADQLFQIVTQNVGILGDLAAEKGEKARVAYNTFVTEMGWPEEIILKEEKAV